MPAYSVTTTSNRVTVTDDRSGQSYSHEPPDARRWGHLMAFDLDLAAKNERTRVSSRRLALPGPERLLTLYDAWGLAELIFSRACSLSQDAADPDDEEEDDGVLCCETEGAHSLEHLGADVVVAGNTVRIAGE